ncbi:MAG: right-handed parallel beta-helix repeat-containing protein, partial [Ilumatobacteraceae bacterium]|nr:right-handed parallel beta-helix repeat-containing protein [Ilumatobacteraceae bacterium]
TVENLTTQNYTNNGVFWTGVTGYRGSYLTAYRNGDYGIYAFDSVQGQLDNSYAAGSPDAGFYIGQCFPCDALIDEVHAEHNGLGYSGTDSGGNLAIVNSTFNNNRAGVVPNSGSYELCYPQRQTTIIGNLVYSNNQPDTPAIDVAILAMGNGILVPGGVANTIERNRVWDHDKTGIGLVPFLEEAPNDDLPTEDEWDLTCDEQRDQPIADEIPDVLLWEPYDNSVVDNVVSDSREADLGVAGVSVPAQDLRNCWSANTFGTSAPVGIETLAPCDGTGSGDWDDGPLDVLAWLDEVATRPPSVDYETAELPPIPTNLPNMADAAAAPAQPATDVPYSIDLASIEVPAEPPG